MRDSSYWILIVVTFCLAASHYAHAVAPNGKCKGLNVTEICAPHSCSEGTNGEITNWYISVEQLPTNGCLTGVSWSICETDPNNKQRCQLGKLYSDENCTDFIQDSYNERPDVAGHPCSSPPPPPNP